VRAVPATTHQARADLNWTVKATNKSCHAAASSTFMRARKICAPIAANMPAITPVAKENRRTEGLSSCFMGRPGRCSYVGRGRLTTEVSPYHF
jgi:hypothetical protein